jgi:hypothetical protein
MFSGIYAVNVEGLVGQSRLMHAARSIYMPQATGSGGMHTNACQGVQNDVS